MFYPAPKYSHPVSKDSTRALEAMAKVRRLEDTGASTAAVDLAYDDYWDVVDDDRKARPEFI